MKVILIIAIIIVVIILVNTVKTIRANKLQKDLLKATKMKDIASVKRLMEKGAKTHWMYYEKYDKTPLEIAVENKDKETVSYLIEKGGGIYGKKNPLLIAVENNDKDMVLYLIEKGADMNSGHPLDYAKDDEIIDLLKSRGAITQKEQNLVDANFIKAVKQHDVKKVKQLIPQLSWQGVDIIPANVSDNPYMPQDELKIDLRINGDKVEQKNITPLLYAAFECDFNMLKVLVENGADMNARSSAGLTALMLAVMKSNVQSAEQEHTVEIIDFLIEKGADINAKSYNVYTLIDRTALMIATAAGNIDAVTALIKNGADLNIKSEADGVTALSSARIKGYKGIENLLLKNGALV